MKARNPISGNFEEVYVKALDSMPVGTQVEYTGSTIPVGWEQVNDYSETELDTGKRWVDGKKIYRKVYKISSGTISYSSGSYTSALGSVGTIDTIINYYGVIRMASGGQRKIGVPAFNGVQANFGYINHFWVEKGSSNINLYSINGGSNQTSISISDSYVVLEYTKSS